MFITLNTTEDTLPLISSTNLSNEIGKKNYFSKVVISFFIYLGTFFVFYFLKKKSLYFDPDNLKLLGFFLLSVIVGAIFSKKFIYIKHFEYGLTLGKLFLSLLISLITLILLFHLFEIQHKMPTYMLGALFSGLVIEAFYFIMLGTKEKNKISFIKNRNLSFKYLLFDFLILTFFCSVEIVTNLYNTLNETEIILIAVIFISWLFSAGTTHRFLPLFISNTRWDAFELQVKFYLRIIILVVLSMILLHLEYSSSIYFIKILVGYSLASSLIYIFYFAPKVENKTDDATSRFLKAYKIKEPILSSHAVTLDSKYSLTSTRVNDIIVKQKIQFEYLKEYKEVFAVLNSMLDLESFDTRKTIIIKSDEPNDISLQRPDSYQLFINLHILNDQNNLNNYLCNLRNSLLERGVFVGAFHPHLHRYNRFLKKYHFWIGNTLYFFDLIWKRIFPKLPFTRELYFKFRKTKDQAISLAEGLGRLIYTGYKILDLAVVNDVVYFAAVKDESPTPEKKVFFSPVFKMKRIGKGGKTIYVYKLRTMYPYSEFIQKFVYENNSLQLGGKFKDDFRVPFWGKLFRKLFIDELPMLINWVKRDLKLVGVRPMSNQYMSLYSTEHQERRKNFKPGLVPPFYADLPKTIKEIELSEKRYLDAFEKNPIKTDIKYFFKCCYNIIIKQARSS